MLSPGSSFIISTACRPPQGGTELKPACSEPLGKLLEHRWLKPASNQRTPLKTSNPSRWPFSRIKKRDRHRELGRSGAEKHPSKFPELPSNPQFIRGKRTRPIWSQIHSYTFQKPLEARPRTPAPPQLTPGEADGNSRPHLPQGAPTASCSARKINYPNRVLGAPTSLESSGRGSWVCLLCQRQSCPLSPGL